MCLRMCSHTYLGVRARACIRKPARARALGMRVHKRGWVREALSRSLRAGKPGVRWSPFPVQRERAPEPQAGRSETGLCDRAPACTADGG